MLFPRSRLLLREGGPVTLGSRAFDLLLVLLRSRGEVVTKDDIVREVWPHTIVEESNLRFQMASLRNALGEDRDLIKTIPGRGYLFAAEPPLLEQSGFSQGHREGEARDSPGLGPPLREPKQSALDALLRACVEELRKRGRAGGCVVCGSAGRTGLDALDARHC
jgi:DNA-binding winged helix-turn-helix (wHTH) protein